MPGSFPLRPRLSRRRARRRPPADSEPQTWAVSGLPERRGDERVVEVPDGYLRLDAGLRVRAIRGRPDLDWWWPVSTRMVIGRPFTEALGGAASDWLRAVRWARRLEGKTAVAVTYEWEREGLVHLRTAWFRGLADGGVGIFIKHIETWLED
jgi:hypothetical protein